MSIYSQTFLYLYRLLLFLPQKTGMRENISIIGRGIGQVMFQNNALSGIIMLIGIICNSWQLAILAVAGTVVGTIAASLLNYDKEDIRAGLYGFNGTLVGIAIGVFMEINIVSIALLVIGAAISSWVAHCFRRQSLLPGFTAPFILVVWLLLITCHYLYPAILLPSLSENPDNASHFFQSFSLNIGQVMFQGNILSGLFFLLAILINSRINAFYTVIAAALPLLIGLFPNIDLTAWNIGLFGYNGVLCAIALGDYTHKGNVKVILSVILSILLQIGGMQIGMTTLTAPFVISVWMINLLWRIKQA